MERATDFLERLALVLQEDLELPIARRKARVTSARMQVAREVARRLRRRGFRACQALEVPGVEARP
eukprot:6174867-Pyramimonas_sp.AAC.1